MSYIKSVLSKINFAVGNNPHLKHYPNETVKRFIPSPYKAVFILSTDFELAWAWRYAKNIANLKEAIENYVQSSRKNVPLILELCDHYKIPLTWAIVGHLFLDNCHRKKTLVHQNLRRIPYHRNNYWEFNAGDWFDDDPATDWKSALQWYAPDLIKSILGANTKHEIACHTFSHIDCRDGICPEYVFKDEINECVKIAREWGIQITSFVHPANMIGNIKLLKEYSFNSYRDNSGNYLTFPQQDKNGLWKFFSTSELAFRKEWSTDYHIYRYCTIIKRAIEFNRLCYFWFHLSTESEFLITILENLFEFLSSNRKSIFVTTTKDYINFIENEKK
ncbi:MAG: hypothetical protein A2Y62_16530 [Candidatus Fischerbacteria bacterium RBG_13_37_8]|uniref:Uncharacterized protein n=1 Tax=Candidatus Fischerbacteria bacterium RBG_13_37_8 TaxID=1817863 RepID=A0A1F5VNQ6_9BACT|nr:MAG: hypothetical protein A2Y62_16530 [Candidatus Fischerbacteria bacterium RBG_13_37_8]